MILPGYTLFLVYLWWYIFMKIWPLNIYHYYLATPQAWDLVPRPRDQLVPPTHKEHELTTGWPGKSGP